VHIVYPQGKLLFLFTKYTPTNKDVTGLANIEMLQNNSRTPVKTGKNRQVFLLNEIQGDKNISISRLIRTLISMDVQIF